MAEIRNNYSSTDFSTFKKDGDEFSRVSVAAVNASHNEKKLKVKY